jgi:hypothetical protein
VLRRRRALGTKNLTLDSMAHVLRMGAGVFEKGGKEKEKGGVFVYQESLFHFSIC